MTYYVAIWCLLAFTASIKADGGLGLGGLIYAPGHASADYYAYPRYAFEYAVKDPHTGDNKAQWEKRDGDVVKGAYSLVEPDGSLRIVEYWADDKSGFNAVVKRVGPNLHPTTVPAAPIYKAPIPLLGSAAISAPISIGPIAKYSGLASAPLISGPLGLGGAAVSTASLYKAAPIAVTAPIAPVLSAPIVKSAPILGPSPYLSGAQWSPLPGPIIAAPAPLLKGPIGGYGNYGLGLAKGGYDNIGLGLAKGGYGYDNLGLGLAKGGYGYDNLGLGLAKGGYGYDNLGVGLAKGGNSYDNLGLGLAKGVYGYDNLGLGLAKGGYGYDNLGLGLAKGGYGYDNYGLGYAKAGPVLPIGGAWGGPLGGLGWKQ